MERIIISQFAGLNEVTLETAPIMVLIGPPASGKSISAKLLYFFREIGSRLSAAATDSRNVDEYRAECRKRFCRYFPAESWGDAGFSITYKIKNQHVSITYTPREGKLGEELVELSWSEFYESALARIAERRRGFHKATTESEPEKLEEANRRLREEIGAEIDQTLGNAGRFQQIFIPAGRAFFAVVQASIFRTLESGQDLDPFLVAFGAFLEESKGLLVDRGFFGSGKKNFKDWGVFRTAMGNILRAEFVRMRKQDFFRHVDGRQVRLAQASSGQQEALPLLLVLARFLSLSHPSGRAVYIEEPEAHLFPTTQRQIVELMAQAYRARHQQMSVVVTTHSPYILTALNNLLQAGQQYGKASKTAIEKLEKIVPRSRSLNPGEVVAYALSDGKARSIIASDTKLIDAAMIDEVSTQIAVEFDRLLWDV